MKKIVAQFNIAGFTAQKYSQTIKDLAAAGVGKPSGRLYHIAAQQGNGMIITDIWESEETLNKFSEKLIPILIKNGVTPAKPVLLPLHNIIE